MFSSNSANPSLVVALLKFLNKYILTMLYMNSNDGQICA